MFSVRSRRINSGTFEKSFRSYSGRREKNYNLTLVNSIHHTQVQQFCQAYVTGFFFFYYLFVITQYENLYLRIDSLSQWRI